MSKKDVVNIVGMIIGVVLAVGGFAGPTIVNSTLLEPSMADAMVDLRDGPVPGDVREIGYQDYTDDIMAGALELVNETLEGEENIAMFVNYSIAMELLYQNMQAAIAVDYGVNGYTEDQNFSVALNAFFNSQDYFPSLAGLPNDPYALIKNIDMGVNETHTMFSGQGIEDPQPFTALAMGHFIQNESDTVPGIFEDDFNGVPGVLAYLEAVSPGVEAYLTSLAGIPDPTLLDPYRTLYNATANQISLFTLYLTQYLFPTTNPLVPTVIGGQVGFSVPACTGDTALDYIKLQWATSVLLPDGLSSLEPGAEGFELLNTSIFTNFGQVLGLWEANNETSFLNETGIITWYNATQGSQSAKDDLQEGTNFTMPQIEEIVEWYWNDTMGYNICVGFEVLLKNTVASELNIPMNEFEIYDDEEFYRRVLLLQWERMAVSEDPVEIEGVSGLEANLTESNYLNRTTRLNLWNDSFAYAFTTEPGMEVWLKAAKGDEEAITELKENVPLTKSQIGELGEWILHMRDDILLTVGVETGEISSGTKSFVDILRNYGMYIGIAGVVLALITGYLKFK